MQTNGLGKIFGHKCCCSNLADGSSDFRQHRGSVMHLLQLSKKNLRVFGEEGRRKKWTKVVAVVVVVVVVVWFDAMLSSSWLLRSFATNSRSAFYARIKKV